MRPDREMALAAMRNMGWTAERTTKGKHPAWRFTRADTGGLYDRVERRQDNLDMGFVADIAMQYDDAPELVADIQTAKEKWLRSRFLGIFSRATAEGAKP